MANFKLNEFVKRRKNKHVLVMGLGLHGGGLGTAEFFARIESKVTITDLKPLRKFKNQIEKLSGFKNINLVLGKHRKEDFKNADLVIKNPAVLNNSPYLRVAHKNNVPVDTDIGIFFDLCPAQIIGVTGTKGKSTTVNLISQILRTKFKTFTAGNIGKSVLPLLFKLKPSDKVVLELSSWQLEGLARHKKGPRIAVITRIAEDHLNRYATLQDYIDAKKNIFKYQKKSDILILNSQDPNQNDWATETKSNVTWFKGENEKAAAEVGKILKVPKKGIRKAIRAAKPLEGRREIAAKLGGVEFINDTTATTPIAVINSLASIKKPIILITGGEDKKLDYREMCKVIKDKVRKLILLPGTATDKLKYELDNLGCNYIEAVNMKNAVQLSQKESSRGDTIILSPGAASFNMFDNEFHRGREFVRYVKK